MGHDHWQKANPTPLAQQSNLHHCAMATPLEYAGSEIHISTGRSLFFRLFSLIKSSLFVVVLVSCPCLALFKVASPCLFAFFCLCCL